MEKKSVSFKIEEDLHKKLRIIAKNENRSMSKQAYITVKRFIFNYEKEHGEIQID